MQNYAKYAKLRISQKWPFSHFFILKTLKKTRFLSKNGENFCAPLFFDV